MSVIKNLINLIDNNEYIKSCFSNEKRDYYSLSYLIDRKLSQSDCIKLGIGIEKILIDIIQYYNKNLLNIKEKNKKNIKEKDHLFKDTVKKIIFYTEIKANLKLDTEKTKSTINKCLEIKDNLIKIYPDYEIKMSLLYLRFYDKKFIPVDIIKKFELIKDNLIGINDYFNILNLNIKFNDEFEFKYFLNQIVEKMFKPQININGLSNNKNIQECENKECENKECENNDKSDNKDRTKDQIKEQPKDQIKEQPKENKKIDYDYKTLNNENKDELIKLCRTHGIKKYSKKTKKEIVKLLCLYFNIQCEENQTENKEQTNQTENKEQNKQIKEQTNQTKENKEQNKQIKEQTKELKPLIKWSGGKSDEIKLFEKYIPKNYNIYLEPFIGGGSLYFYLNPIHAVISDVHKELIDLYQCIAEGKSDEIYDFMDNNLNDEKSYYRIRDEMEINNKVDSAKRFYYQRKTCFRGMLRYNKDGKFNIPFGKYKSINYQEIKNIKYEILLKRTTILNKSYEYIFENFNDENNFMFLDPPYDSEFTDYGYCKFDQEEQKKLFNLFKNTKIKCLMIIGKTNFIENLYKNYIIGEYDKKYRFKLYNNRVGDEINNKHLIICNYAV
jgi:DNA adenine methylase